MNDALLMGRFESLGNLLGDAECFIDRNRSACDPLVEALAVDKVQYEELRAAGFLQAVDLSDVRMVQCSEHLRFAVDPRDAFGVVREAIREELEGDVATELRVADAIHFRV